MIITEFKYGQRNEFRLITSNYPDEVRTALAEFDKTLLLLWNLDDNQWEVYRIKSRGGVSADDVIHWQLSYPHAITLDLINYLKKKDTNPSGYLDTKEMFKKWFNLIKKNTDLRLYRQATIREAIINNAQWYTRRLGACTDQIAVPVTVGYNKKTGKKIMAVKNV